MHELIEQTGDILAQSKELLNLPGVKSVVTGFISWIGKKIFAGKKSAQEKLKLLEQQNADAETIASLKANLELMLEDNTELREALAEKVKEVTQDLEKVGVQLSKTNTANVSGTDNQVFQDITGNVSTTKIGRQINQGDNSTYNENKK